MLWEKELTLQFNENIITYICHRCNEGFGAFNDDDKIMEKALKWNKEQIKKV